MGWKSSTSSKEMILLACSSLDLSGVPTYTYTLYKKLIQKGYDVMVYSGDAGGFYADKMNCVHTTDKIPTPDVIYAQYRDCAILLREVFPLVPMIFSAHGVLPDGEQPPRINIQRYITINEDGFDNMVRQYVPPEKIDIVRDFIDVDTFKPRTTIYDRLISVLYVSNYKPRITYQVISEACKRMGIKFKAVGAPYGRAKNIVADINSADLVVSSGRAILEGMACGRAVLSWENGYGDGYITPEVYWISRTRNFGGRYCFHNFTVDTMIKELEKYTPEHFGDNRDLILQYHNADLGTEQVLAIIRRVMEESNANALQR